MASTAILWAAFLSEASLANDECGTGTSVICDAGDADYSTFFPNGISYDPVADLTLIVDGSAAIAPNPGIKGIDVDSSAGSVHVTLVAGSSIITSGNSAFGAWIDDAASVTLESAASIITNGSYSKALIVGSTTGSVKISLSNVSSIETFGDQAPAVHIDDSTGAVSLLNEGKLRTSGFLSPGIWVSQSDDDVSILLSSESSIETSGDRSRGLRISSAEGDVTLLSYGTIETSGFKSYGIEVIGTYGSLEVTTSGAITTLGKLAHGIYLTANYGPVSLTSSNITTSGDKASAIYVYANYEESIDITHAGHITTSGAYAHGIHVYSPSWPTNPPGAPVSIATSTGSTITVSGDGADGIHIANYGDSITDITLDLAGSIDVQGTGAAIRIIGDSPVTLNNTGTIGGMVITGDGDDQFTNEGMLRTGFVDMGAGDDTLINAGTLELTGATGAITNVESFTNSGIIDLANRTAGDALSISGDFIADGGELHLDSSLDTGIADLLTLDAVAASSNPTLIHIIDIGGGGPASSPILLVNSVSDASNGSAFDLAYSVFGAYQYELTYDPGLFDWSLELVGIYPGTAEYPALVSGALLGWHSDLPSLHARLQDLRWTDADEERIEPAAWTGASPALRPWLQLVSASQEIGTDTPFDLDVAKLEAGLDARRQIGDALYSFGAFAGGGRSLQNFAGSTTSADASLLLAGLYGGYRHGGLYGDAVLKYERQLADYRGLATADEDAPFTVDLFGGSAEAGYRFALPQAYLQPRLRLSYAHAWAGSFEDASGSPIDLENADSLRGEIGTRVGVPLGLADLFADASLGHEFLGETEAQVSGLSFTHELPATAARLASGFALNLLGDKLTLSLEASYARGDEAEEFTATGGLRLRN